MFFNSLTFALFFVVVLAVYYVLSHRAQNAFLLVASYVFYGFWDWRFLGLLAISTAVDFTVARRLEGTDAQRTRRLLLFVSVATNLGILGFFKYCDFFIASAAGLLELAGFESNTRLLNIVLPVGISFYTFQSMGYTIDVFRRKQEATRDLLSFALYVAYFPQLVAGPIERASRLLPQIVNPRRVGRDEWYTGTQLILWGYVKKVAIADGLAPYVDAAFANPEGMTAGTLWLALYCFALQIYCDFSGYSDIARGISRLFGIELMINFRQPYLSRNITEFWRRWHISLSTWLRDYLYISLGGNRLGRAKQYRNLMLVMLLGGLWHGAGWTFVVWGGLHGLYLMVHRFFAGTVDRSYQSPPSGLRTWLSYSLGLFVTFQLVCVAWVAFRADTIEVAFAYFAGMMAPLFNPSALGLDELIPGLVPTLVFYGVCTLALDVLCWRGDHELPVLPRWHWAARGLAYASGLLVLMLVRESDGAAFVYFQF